MLGPRRGEQRPLRVPVPLRRPGQVFDPCLFANACDHGNLCLDAGSATECDADAQACCLPVCDTTEPNTCPGQGQACIPYFEACHAPPGYEHIGVCSLPE